MSQWEFLEQIVSCPYPAFLLQLAGVAVVGLARVAVGPLLVAVGWCRRHFLVDLSQCIVYQPVAFQVLSSASGEFGYQGQVCFCNSPQ